MAPPPPPPAAAGGLSPTTPVPLATVGGAQAAAPAVPTEAAPRKGMASRIDAALADDGTFPASVAAASAEPAPSVPAKSAAPPPLARTPFDDVEGVDVDGVFEPEDVLDGETFEDAVLEPEPEPAPQPMLLTPEPEPEPVLAKAPAPELARPAPVQELTELSPEPEPEPVKAEVQELPELTAEPEPVLLTPEPEPVKAEAQELPELTAEPELEPEPKAEPKAEQAPAQELATPEPAKAPPRDETTESGVWALEGSQPKAREVEPPAPPPEPVAEVKPRQPIDLGELPPAPEEPMQLAATWEFMGMAEAQGHATTPTSEDRGMELESHSAASTESVGSPHDEVALASTWDFVPQWQPGAPAGTPEPSAAPPAPVAPVAERAAAAPVVSTQAPVDPVTTAKFGIGPVQSTDAPVNPATTAKFGIGTGAPAGSHPFEDEGAAPGEGLPAAPAVKAEAGWDQMFPAEEPVSPVAQAPAPEADPFTEFAAEAARKRDEKPPKPEEGEGS